ncbi:MAG: asparagine synthase-related protein [Syntrophales bacterium]|jgi:asparagine synthase (glutamine-hydrolysing)|nr:asparagine synthase-related protein [Syntrophales bacterium]MDY0043215.1 asparagine synthase-related protein [Syntrophales bacterium]
MSGIAGQLGNNEAAVSQILENISHRGPHGTVTFDEGSIHLGINELNVGGDSREGSHSASKGKKAVVLDGRIYNEALSKYSDAEAVLSLYEQFGDRFAEKIDGDFACAIRDGSSMILARDEAGVKPLYYGHDNEGNLCFASEAKGLAGISSDLKEFPPGYIYSRQIGFRRFVSTAVSTPDVTTYDQAKSILRELLEKAVEKRMRDNAVTGVLLSGGLDSSLIAAMACRIRPGIQCFTVSMEDGVDLPLARDVTAALTLPHHVRMFGNDDISKVLPEAIHYQEMFEESCVHGAIANFLAGQFIKGKSSCVLTGEGADEFFAGYDGQYKAASNQEEVAAICDTLINVAHNTALQRLDRLNAANGYESRTPFLDAAVMQFARKLPLAWKIHGEDRTGKWILRQAFEDVLPEHIIYQTKRFFAQGSGVAYVMREEAEKNISREELDAFNSQKGNPLLSSVEELYYYRFFKKTFPCNSFDRLVGRWDPLRPDFFPRWEKRI